MSSKKILFAVTLLLACLFTSEARAQCPAGWTAAGPVTVMVPCPPGPDMAAQVWYCYFNPTANDTTCKIQISKVCGGCPGMSQSQLIDAVIDYWTDPRNNNPLGLDGGNYLPCPGPPIRNWTFSRPMCTFIPTGTTCVEVCGGNTGYKCTRTYDICVGPSGLTITLTNTRTEGAGPCLGGCTTGNCP